jgi:hypothetical protein
MEFAVAGKDEHNLPLLEVNMYPVLASGMDSQHLVGALAMPLEDTGLGIMDVESLSCTMDGSPLRHPTGRVSLPRGSKSCSVPG